MRKKDEKKKNSNVKWYHWLIWILGGLALALLIFQIIRTILS